MNDIQTTGLAPPTPTPPTSGQPEQKERNITDNVLARVTGLTAAGELALPESYSAENALKAAYLTLIQTKDRAKNPVLVSCTKESVKNALFDMVVQGLNPQKNQCYFIAYGNELTLLRSYLGTIAVAKRVAGISDVSAQIVYAGDEFTYAIDPTTGATMITKHEQRIENIDDSKITAAYALVQYRPEMTLPDGQKWASIFEGMVTYVEIMTLAQIKTAWGQGELKGDGPAHKKFPGEMAKKTVINRALKRFIGSSDDSSLLMQSYDRTSDNEQLERGAADAEVIEDVAQSVDQILQEGEAAGAPRSPVSGESPEEDTEAGGEI